MKKLRIRKIEVLSAGKIVGIIYFIIGIFLGLVLSIIPTMNPSMMGIGYNSIMYTGTAVILVPILYGAGGFLAGIIGAFLYNLIAGWIGPLEIETD